jgi:hypothetical protein
LADAAGYPDGVTVKDRLHDIVDQMSDEEAEATLRRIAVERTDPLLRLLDAAPIDDEPMSSDEEAALAEVKADQAAGVPRVSFDDIKRTYAEQ